MAYYNPFQNLELRVPEAYRFDVDRFCQTQPAGGARPSPDHSPFERQVDFWFLAICLGARKGKRTPLQQPHKFATGEILSRDPYRIELLELLAISFLRDPWAIEEPRKVIDLANELAATGIPELVTMLTDGNAQPIWNLTDQMIELLPAAPAM